VSERQVARTTIIWKLAQTLCRVFTTVVFDLKVYGVENVPKTGGVLLVSNHQSYLDPVLVGVRLTRPLSYLAKSELFENPFLSWLIRGLNAFPVRQGAGDVGAMKETITRLQDGNALTIFPEGTRSEDGELQPIEKGVSLVVRRAKVPVVLVIIDGSFDAWPKGRVVFRGWPIRVWYGPPMDMSRMKAEEIGRIIDTKFHEMLDESRKMSGI
jgi:1-acyl-sn-glycerol-3-phosphate acyltransferase